MNNKIIPNAIYIHSAPVDTKETIIGYLYVGTKVQLVSYNPNGYCQLTTGGYVWGEYMELAVG